MKKIIIFGCSIVIIIISIFFKWYVDTMKEDRLIKSYNSEYQIYTEKEITGVELTTVINKAIDNNEKYSISKNDKNLYLEDDKNSMKVYIKVTKNGDYFPMEAFNTVGVTEFTKLYGISNFKCLEKQYHENGKISKLYFEITK